MSKNNQKLSILVSCGSYSRGGLEMAAVESTARLRDSGQNVGFLCSAGSELQKSALELGLKTLPFFNSNAKIPVTIFKLRNYLKNSNTEIIHSHHSHDLWALVPALKLAGSEAKLFLTKHLASGVVKKDLFHKFLYGRVNGIFAISNYIMQSVVKTTPMHESKVKLLPNSIDPQKFNKSNYDRNESLAMLNIPPDKTTIGLVGRITPGKGHTEFIEAAGLLNRKFPGKLHFVISGSSVSSESEFEGSIRKKVRDAGIDNIFFTGHVHEVQKIYAGLDILSFPSHDESFGRVLIEAMAMELPVAASGYAGVLDIVTDGVTGLLFEPKNTNSLASSLEKLISEKELRRRLGAAGRKLVEEKFSDEIVFKKLIEYYSW